MKAAFEDWLNADLDTTDNPYRNNSAAYWAWEGWKAGAAAELRRLSAENEAFGIHLSERMKDLARVEAQRDALLEACRAYDKWADKTLCYDRELRPIRAQIRAAIKAAEENT